MEVKSKRSLCAEEVRAMKHTFRFRLDHERHLAPVRRMLAGRMCRVCFLDQKELMAQAPLREKMVARCRAAEHASNCSILLGPRRYGCFTPKMGWNRVKRLFKKYRGSF